MEIDYFSTILNAPKLKVSLIFLKDNIFASNMNLGSNVLTSGMQDYRSN
jgi:hypothetical protein